MRPPIRLSRVMMRRLHASSTTAGTGDLDRVIELIQRINQFNTTTRRYTRQQLQDLLKNDGHRVYVATLADKFGSLGPVAVVIADRKSEESVRHSRVFRYELSGNGLPVRA